MRRAAIILTVISGILFILGLVDYLTNFNTSPGTIFGNPNIVVNEGATLLIADGFLILATLLMWILWIVGRRKGQSDQS